MRTKELVRRVGDQWKGPSILSDHTFGFNFAKEGLACSDVMTKVWVCIS